MPEPLKIHKHDHDGPVHSIEEVGGGGGVSLSEDRLTVVQ